MEIWQVDTRIVSTLKIKEALNQYANVSSMHDCSQYLQQQDGIQNQLSKVNVLMLRILYICIRICFEQKNQSGEARAEAPNRPGRFFIGESRGRVERFVLQCIMEGQIQEITCPVCMSIFRRPATLPCGHTFCFACFLNATREHRNCPICRQHFPSTPAKLRPDHTIATFIDDLRKAHKRVESSKPENIHVQCKEELLLLVDILTEDLLLPFNRIVATFELQSNVLIDRMERFVARQQLPFNKFAVVCRLVHIEQIRRNLFRGVIEGRAFCKVQSENIESQVSLEMDEEDFFYRICRCKQISQSSDSNPNEYSLFFNYFSKINSHELKNNIFHRIDPTVFTSKNDPVALFYSILGILNMDNRTKYDLAVSFEEEARIQQINKYIKNHQNRIMKDPSAMIRVSSSGNSDKRLFFVIVALLFLLWMSKEQYIDVEL